MSLPSGRMVTVRTFLGSLDAVAAPAGGCGAALRVGAAGAATRGAGWGAGSFSATGSSCFDTNCSLPAFTGAALPDCASPAGAGTILVGVELSAVMTGGGCVEPAGPV